jgi:hydroxymethylpyrimidine pyrophosphatase-like HAD family hydrolase
MKNDIRLVIADVDGTLVTQDKVLTPPAIGAVNRLRKSFIFGSRQKLAEAAS